MARKIDWETVKTEYISTNTSIRKLCEKYKVSRSTIQFRCKNENWVGERKKHNTKTVANAVQKVEKSKAKRLASELAAADMLSNAVMKCLKDPEQFNRWVVVEGVDKGVTEASEKIFDKYDTKAMKDLAVVLNTVSNLKRELDGALSNRDQMMLELQKQRIEIEKMRLELDQKKGENSDTREIHVVMTDDLKEWAE